MPPPPPPAHSALSHRSPFVTYTGSWLATASHHSWVHSPPSSSSSETTDGGFAFAFDGTDFAVYGRWDADTAAWVTVDGEATWWHADRAPAALDGEGDVVYTSTVAPGFHKVSFSMAGGRMDLAKVVVGDGPIAIEQGWPWYYLALGATAATVAVFRLFHRRRRHSPIDDEGRLMSEKP